MSGAVMTTSIHRKGEGDAAEYRYWSGEDERYCTAPMPRAALLALVVEAQVAVYGEATREGHTRAELTAFVERAFADADARGTSQRGAQRRTAAWEVERCEGCLNFHPVPNTTGCVWIHEVVAALTERLGPPSETRDVYGRPVATWERGERSVTALVFALERIVRVDVSLPDGYFELFPDEANPPERRLGDGRRVAELPHIVELTQLAIDRTAAVMSLTRVVEVAAEALAVAER